MKFVQHSKISKKFQYFLLALDETTDIKDTAQLAIFIRGVDSQMNVTEELFDLVSFKIQQLEKILKKLS